MSGLFLVAAVIAGSAAAHSAVEPRPPSGPESGRLMDDHVEADCACPGDEILPEGTVVATTYGHWTPGEPPCIVSVRLGLAELDALGAEP